MKRLLLLAFLTSLALSTAQAQTAAPVAAPDASKPAQLVEASCGQCKFGLPGKGCDLAVRVNGQAYFVDGTGIDSHGDAHAQDGFCNAVRQARVQGDVVDNRFRATYFQLVPEPGKAK
ncbi:DUF6370 family protein [Hymenobacter weizhouensis]|uniref:DUF6370 family protein n=1 Tax=Hymenobacter sp. YIM 151500-1 TaxID=2987689 RepID=UPI002227CEA7|nr:DUF6370 family protein [Hymenobacter sp. YIM 151500-1]UYZ63538.1 DUF6370 family protein [Hymenobacter sp. YIM 151500-1]